MGFFVEGAHHEVAPGQHEIDFKPVDAVTAGDNLVTFRFLVRKIAMDNDLHATFMPKPFVGKNGSGLHLYQALFKDGANAFSDPKAKYRLTRMGLQYIAGMLAHARGMTVITNPLVNSYKRLAPNFEAPTHVAWSEVNRNPLIRPSDRRGEGTFCEYRLPDPSCNPYLCLAAVLAAGVEGIRKQMDPGPPVNKDIYRMSQRERSRLRVESLPTDLSEAIRAFQKDKFLQNALGARISDHIIQAKRSEWQEYIGQVHPWELDRYLASY
jgi:glutamine synthetase